MTDLCGICFENVPNYPLECCKQSCCLKCATQWVRNGHTDCPFCRKEDSLKGLESSESIFRRIINEPFKSLIMFFITFDAAVLTAAVVISVILMVISGSIMLGDGIIHMYCGDYNSEFCQSACAFRHEYRVYPIRVYGIACEFKISNQTQCKMDIKNRSVSTFYQELSEAINSARLFMELGNLFGKVDVQESFLLQRGCPVALLRPFEAGESFLLRMRNYSVSELQEFVSGLKMESLAEEIDQHINIQCSTASDQLGECSCWHKYTMFEAFCVELSEIGLPVYHARICEQEWTFSNLFSSVDL